MFCLQCHTQKRVTRAIQNIVARKMPGCCYDYCIGCLNSQLKQYNNLKLEEFKNKKKKIRDEKWRLYNLNRMNDKYQKLKLENDIYIVAAKKRFKIISNWVKAKEKKAAKKYADKKYRNENKDLLYSKKRQYVKKSIEIVADSYVKRLLILNSKNQLKASDLPNELIEQKKLTLLIKRKTKDHDQSSTDL